MCICRSTCDSFAINDDGGGFPFLGVSCVCVSVFLLAADVDYIVEMFVFFSGFLSSTFFVFFLFDLHYLRSYIHICIESNYLCCV